MQIFKLEIDLEDDESGLTFNAIVDRPAHNKRLLTFSKKKEADLIQLSFNDEKRMVTGVAISANQLIERFDTSIGKYYVFFPPKEVEKMVLKLSRKQLLSSVNLMHDEKQVVHGITFVEGYFVTENKRPPVEENVQDGSYVMTYYVEDDVLYKKLKSGKFVGYSVEGLFREIEVKSINNQKSNKMKKNDLFKKIFGKQKFAEVETTDGQVIVYEGQLEVGTAVFLQTEEGEVVAPEGSHTLTDGRTIVVDGNGVVAEIIEAEAEAEFSADDVVEVLAALKADNDSLRSEINEIKERFERFEKSQGVNKDKFAKKGSNEPLWRKAAK